jgi:hypothetical protein
MGYLPKRELRVRGCMWWEAVCGTPLWHVALEKSPAFNSLLKKKQAVAAFVFV